MQAARHDPAHNNKAAGRILSDYLSSRMGQPVAGLTEQRLTDLMLAREISPSLVARTQAVRTKCEIERYAPQEAIAAGGEDHLDEVGSLLDALDQAL